MTTLAEFLLERIAEDETIARAAASGDGYTEWDNPCSGVVQAAGGNLDGLVNAPGGIAIHMARHDPARVLAECDAKRRIVEELQRGVEPGDEWTDPTVLKLLALPYADHPDFREEWRP